MKSLFASLLLPVVTIRRRYLSYTSSARLQSLSINSGGDACPWPAQSLSRQPVSYLAAEPRLTPATNLLISCVATKAKGYAMVKRLGVYPLVTSVLVGPTAAVSSQQLHGLTALQLPEKVYEVDLQALATRQYLAACGCGMN
eukprot:545256-Pleurochrysis_carterae.AAC.1